VLFEGGEGADLAGRRVFAAVETRERYRVGTTSAAGFRAARGKAFNPAFRKRRLLSP
jgi:hypothetical protein